MKILSKERLIIKKSREEKTLHTRFFGQTFVKILVDIVKEKNDTSYDEDEPILEGPNGFASYNQFFIEKTERTKSK